MYISHHLVLSVFSIVIISEMKCRSIATSEQELVSYEFKIPILDGPVRLLHGKIKIIPKTNVNHPTCRQEWNIMKINTTDIDKLSSSIPSPHKTFIEFLLDPSTKEFIKQQYLLDRRREQRRSNTVTWDLPRLNYRIKIIFSILNNSNNTIDYDDDDDAVLRYFFSNSYS